MLGSTGGDSTHSINTLGSRSGSSTPDPTTRKAQSAFFSLEPFSWMKLHRIGRGAFGDVFQCLNTLDGSCFATKQVPTNSNRAGGSSREAVALQKELNILKQLRHPNIVGYIGTETQAGHLYVVVTLVFMRWNFGTRSSLCQAA